VFLVACCVCLTRHIYRLSEFLWLVIYLAYWNSSDSSLQVFFRLLGYWALLKRASRAVPQSGGAAPAGAGACGYFVRVACDTCCLATSCVLPVIHVALRFIIYSYFMMYFVFLFIHPRIGVYFPDTQHQCPLNPATLQERRGGGRDWTRRSRRRREG
jgi:hypothetical protein